MMNKNSILQIDRILDYYDMPQLFTARDVFDTLYLCLLYADTPMCRYTAIRLSSQRLHSFLSGKTDLRDLFLHPETDNEYFDVVFDNGEYQIGHTLHTAITEDRLPEKGYKMNGDDKENVIVHLPIKDRNLLQELVRKFGWACM